MAYPIAAGVRNIGSDTMRYIPIIYSAKVMKAYRDRTVLTKITNTDYEGEIKKYGDTVWIRKDPELTVRDYRKGQNLVNEQPESEATSLYIGKGKYWSFVSYDLDQVQTDLKNCLGRWAEDGSFQISKAIDTEVLAHLPANASSYNRGSTAGYKSANINLGVDGTPLSVTKADILEAIVDAGTVLDEQNVPEQGRFMVISPRVAGLISKSDLKDCSLTGDSKSVIRTGYLGEIARFSLYQSNLLPYGSSSSTSVYCPFGVKDAVTFATQMVASKIMDDPNGFGKLHRGLNVYGYKVVKPEGLGVLLLSVG
jgi:hypothetical protein